jgi:hypothetical protein
MDPGVHLAWDFSHMGRSEDVSDAEEAENSDEGFRPRIDDEKRTGIEIFASVAEG